MATKDLSRTIIEGGRSGYYKAECREEIRAERAAWRAQARIIARDPERWDEEPDARRGPVMVDFADKLSPIYRFIDSRVGRSWDKTRSELFSKFDTRTTAGRHALHDHLLRDVSENPEPSPSIWQRDRYFRDAEGLLREREWRGVRAVRGIMFGQEKLREVAAWLGPVKIGRAGAGFARYVPAGKGPFRARAVVEAWQIVYACTDGAGRLLYVEQPPHVSTYSGKIYPQSPKIRIYVAPYRQDGMLGSEEAEFFRSLPKDVQDAVCKLAPANH